MVYTLQYQSKELIKSDFFKLRNLMNSENDIMHLNVIHSHLQDLSTEDLYKKVLSLEGRYRTKMNKWRSPLIKLRVINQL